MDESELIAATDKIERIEQSTRLKQRVTVDCQARKWSEVKELGAVE